jgi:two-component system invasion response regulator UvrY
LSDIAAESLAQHMAGGKRHTSPLDTLSNREIQVLRHLALGRTVKEIAQAYNLSPNTVHTYRLRLLKKLNLRNNSEISRFAIQNRLVEI